MKTRTVKSILITVMLLSLLVQMGCTMVSNGVAYGDSLFTNRDFDYEYSTQDAVIISFSFALVSAT